MAAIYHVLVSKSINKSIDRIPLPWRQRIQLAIDGLEINPYAGIKMNGQLKDKRKLKVWPYRVLYKVYPNQKIVEIYEVEHRGSMSND